MGSCDMRVARCSSGANPGEHRDDDVRGSRYAFTSGHPPSPNGRHASEGGMAASCEQMSYFPFERALLGVNATDPSVHLQPSQEDHLWFISRRPTSKPYAEV